MQPKKKYFQLNLWENLNYYIFWKSLRNILGRSSSFQNILLWRHVKIINFKARLIQYNP